MSSHHSPGAREINYSYNIVPYSEPEIPHTPEEAIGLILAQADHPSVECYTEPDIKRSCAEAVARTLFPQLFEAADVSATDDRRLA